MTLQVVVFSRARPLQLHGYLTSMYQQGHGDIRTSVLARVDPEYADAYGQAVREFPGLTVRYETDFAADLSALMGDADFTMFGCDDVVYVEPFGVDTIAAAFKDIPYLLGLSLRLGKNVVRDMFGAPMRQPLGTTLWDVYQGVVDWAYPWEFDGTVYRTPFVKTMVAMLNAPTPNLLEERGSRRWGECTDLHHMAAYPTSRLVVPTVNVVQHDFPNGISSRQELPPEFLLDCWNHGLRLDVGRYAGMAPESWRVGDFFMKTAT